MCLLTTTKRSFIEEELFLAFEVTRSLLCGMSLPKTFWSDAVFTACYLINRLPTRVLNGKSPFSMGFPDSIVFSLSGVVLVKHGF